MSSDKLSAQDRKDLKALEERFGKGQYDSLEALEEIRDRRLYRENYETFEDYMAAQWGHSRQWATQNLNWLRMNRLLKAQGKSPYQIGLSAADAQVLVRLENEPELLVQAIVEADAEVKVGGKRTKSMLQTAVKRMEKLKETRKTVPDITFEENRTLSNLGKVRKSQPDLVEAAMAKSKVEERPLVDCLIDECRSQHGLPADTQLLAIARGQELIDLIEPLATLMTEWQEVEELKSRRAALEGQMATVNKDIAEREGTSEQVLLESATDGPTLKDIAAERGIVAEPEEREPTWENLVEYLTLAMTANVPEATSDEAQAVEEFISKFPDPERALQVMLFRCRDLIGIVKW
jgi:hypothetical protein